MYVIDGTEDNKPSRIPHIIPRVLCEFIVSLCFSCVSVVMVMSLDHVLCYIVSH